jgi:peptide/nickel transport system substrate-binding protein
MKFKAMLKKLSVASLATVCVFAVASCKSCKREKNPTDTTKYYDNESDSLVFSTLEVDKVFNPFFSTSGTDSNVVGMTQIGMLANDRSGNVTYGDEYPTVTKDLQISSNGGKENVDLQTTYYFVLKNNIKFSNGSALTIKDVLFNLYVYLDKAYTGSSTIYSTDIVGLQQYRTQADDENEQKSFDEKFQTKSMARIQALVDAATEIKDEIGTDDITSDEFRQKLQDEWVGVSDTYKNVVNDYDKALELFDKELETDYTNSLNSYEDIKFTDDKGQVHSNLLTTDVEAFLYNEGYITWNKKDAKLSCSLGGLDQLKAMKPEDAKAQAISLIKTDKIPYDIDLIVEYYNTGVQLDTFITAQEMEEYFKNETGRKYKNISGIQFANHTAPVTVNGKEYGVPEYTDDGAVRDGSNEVLSITINNVDPKAIWNFAFAVAPMYYYSDAEHIAKFDYEENFGVEYNSLTFMNDVVNSSDKIGVPVGAGAYAASKSSGGIDGIKSTEFYNLGIIYYERNPYYVMGPATIKKLRLKVVSSNQMLNQLYAGEIDFAEPNSKPETISELDGKKKDGIGNQPVQTAGYGYIGVNAGKVPSLAVRQVIMHCINTQEIVNYYHSTASAIYRSMSQSSWAYPWDSTSYYPFIGGEVPEDLSVVNPVYAEYVTSLGKKAGDKLTDAEQKQFIIDQVEGAGYTLNDNGVYQNGESVLKYTFTIAGQETDHPAWGAMSHAGDILNTCGFDIFVTTDSRALKKLATGDLTVWAAAWGSTIDPDMYQVYHRESKATSTLNWGYKQIISNIGGKYDVEDALLTELSGYIDDARKTNDQTKRAAIYKKALDIVMQLAIELPTYQRDDLFAYNASKIDATTFAQNPSPYYGLTSDLYSISLNEEK